MTESSDWIDLPDRSMPPEAQPVNERLPLPHPEEALTEASPTLRPPPPVLGIPVSPETMARLFQRKPPVADEETPPPRVRCRDARREEIPSEAHRAAEAARGRGLTVRVTYAQGGVWRRWGDRGECATCHREVLMAAEDKRNPETGEVLRGHNQPAVRCPGGPTDWIGGETGIVCAACRTVPKKVNRNGSTPPHVLPAQPCPDRRSVRLIPGEPREPLSSIAVRVHRTGVACWMTEVVMDAKGRPALKASFDLAFLVVQDRLVSASAAEFQKACRGET